MLELVIGKESGVIDNASIPIRWCIDTETMEKLKDHKNVKILIQVKYDQWTEDRFMVKLSNYMTYVPCRRAGEVEISAYLVYAESEKRSLNYALDTVFMMRDGAKYTRGFNIDCPIGKELYIKHDDVSFGHCSMLEIVHDTYKVNIPKNVFGKELPKWFDDLVNRYLSSKTYDECGKRKRVMGFLFVRSWFMMLDALASELRMIAMFGMALMFGWYHITLKRLKHPFKEGWECWSKILKNDVKSKNIVELMYDITHAKAKKKYKTYEQNYIPKFFGQLAAAASLPMIPVIYAGYVVLGITTVGMPLEIALITPFLTNTAILIVLGICTVFIGGIIAGLVWIFNILVDKFSLGTIVNWIIDPIFNTFDWIVEKSLLLEKWINDFFDRRDLKKELLTCNGDANSVTTDIKKIPLKERSIQLMYLDIKNKVCKPMAR